MSFCYKLLLLTFTGIAVLLGFTYLNSGMPLWYDHGAYRHFVHLLWAWHHIQDLPQYLQHQFEPFSGTFFYVLAVLTEEKYVYGYWYVILYIFIGLALFLLWKRKWKYTCGSFLGLAFFIFSLTQYNNFWWSFGKQMFSTFFLLLFFRYYHKYLLSIVLLIACIALHRMTGFLAILYVLLSSFLSFSKKQRYAFLIAVIIAILSYLPTFDIQVLPFLSHKINHYIFLSGTYGTGLPPGIFWAYEIPVALLCFIAIFYLIYSKRVPLKHPLVWLVVIITWMVISRSIAHTRLQSFVDLFFIIFLVRFWYFFLPKKVIIIILLIQAILWSIFVFQWHTPFLSQQEDLDIQKMLENIPKNVSLVTLTGAYMSSMTSYYDGEIYSTYQGIGSDVFNKDELTKMRRDKKILCKNLGLLPHKVFVYFGVKEKFTSTQNNQCLSLIKKWNTGAQLLYYNGFTQ